MRPPNAHRTAIAATCLALAALGAAQAIAAGGLSVSPGILEATARPGSIGALKVSNTSPRPMKVRLAVRPWVQARSGSVTPDRREVLGKVRPSRDSFWLGAGAAKSLRLSLARRPAHGSLYGAIELTGSPRYAGHKPIKVAYRLITSMRLNPPSAAQRFSAQGGRLFQHGTTRHGGLYLAVENTGNTIVPIGATLDLKGKGRSLRNTATPKTILPGATVNLELLRLRGALPGGRYSAKVALTQGGRRVGTLRRGLRLG